MLLSVERGSELVKTVFQKAITGAFDICIAPVHGCTDSSVT